MQRFLLILGCCLLTLIGTIPAPASAAPWPPIGAACTPDRASHPGTAGHINYCDCPPASLCPTTAEEYNTPSLQKMPSNYIFGLNGYAQCCPDQPKCPDGKIMPSSGVCPQPPATQACGGCYVGPMGRPTSGLMIPQKFDDFCCPDDQSIECTLHTTSGLSQITEPSDCSTPTLTSQWKTARCIANTACTPAALTCPAGTNMAGQPMPQDRECNRCQDGTTLAGQVAAYGQCTPTGCVQNLSGTNCKPPVPSTNTCIDACGEVKRHGQLWCETGYSYGGSSPLRSTMRCNDGKIENRGAISGIGCDSIGGPLNCL